jgi:EpsD family peptidyl-prolyl cis-trans isomerase
MALHSRTLSCLTLTAALLVLTACGKGEGKPATQVAAKVNKEEISVHQINYVLSHSGAAVPADQAKQASRQVLEKLIDQELLVKKALDDKLDRDPNIMQALENSRRQILAQAYLEKVSSAASKPSADEIRTYFGKHPELFAERKIYRLQTLEIKLDQGLTDELKGELAKRKTMNDVVAWAKDKNLLYRGDVVVKSAEQLPMPMLPRLNEMKDGQIGLIPEANAVSVIQLLASQAQPVDEKNATPLIEQFLLNQRRTELAQNEIKQLRGAASIELVGEFAAAEKTQPAEKQSAAEAPASTPAAAAAPTAASKQAEAVSRGLAGLK